MIRTPRRLAALLTLAALSPAVTAQLKTFGGNGKMQTSSVYLWDAGKQKLVGSYSFIYGAPDWKDSHDKQVDSKESGSIRLGKNEWATLDTSVAMTIGGMKIPAGQWYLGLRREDGKFALMVMEAKTIRKLKVASWMTGTVKAKINAPLTYAKVEAKASKLQITAKADPANPVSGTFTLHWGHHQLTAKIEVDLKAENSEKKGTR